MPLESNGLILLSPARSGCPLQPEQMRNAGTIDIGIEQPDLGSGASQAQRNAGGDRAFPDAPFARADGDDAFRRDANLPQLLRRPRVDGQVHRDRFQLRKPVLQQLLDRSFRLFPQRRRMRGQRHREREPIAGQTHFAHLLHLSDAAARFRVFEFAQSRQDCRFVNFSGSHENLKFD